MKRTRLESRLPYRILYQFLAIMCQLSTFLINIVSTSSYHHQLACYYQNRSQISGLLWRNLFRTEWLSPSTQRTYIFCTRMHMATYKMYSNEKRYWKSAEQVARGLFYLWWSIHMWLSRAKVLRQGTTAKCCSIHKNSSESKTYFRNIDFFFQLLKVTFCSVAAWIEWEVENR